MHVSRHPATPRARYAQAALQAGLSEASATVPQRDAAVRQEAVLAMLKGPTAARLRMAARGSRLQRGGARDGRRQQLQTLLGQTGRAGDRNLRCGRRRTRPLKKLYRAATKQSPCVPCHCHRGLPTDSSGADLSMTLCTLQVKLQAGLCAATLKELPESVSMLHTCLSLEDFRRVGPAPRGRALWRSTSTAAGGGAASSSAASRGAPVGGGAYPRRRPLQL